MVVVGWGLGGEERERGGVKECGTGVMVLGVEMGLRGKIS